MKNIYIASDHGGFALKKTLIKHFNKLIITDFGPFVYDKNDDYPDFVIPLAKKIASDNTRGIVICKNGIGVSIAVNKIKGIRCGIGYNKNVAKTMMLDDNTNIISLPAKHLKTAEAIKIVEIWLKTGFSKEERHIRRLKKIEKYENNSRNIS
jgi:ribose 5-phosphate isomerase B